MVTMFTIVTIVTVVTTVRTVTLQGWILFIIGSMAVQHYEWIVMELMPIHDLNMADDELERLRSPSAFYEPYKMVGKWLRRIIGRELPPMKSAAQDRFSTSSAPVQHVKMPKGTR